MNLTSDVAVWIGSLLTLALYSFLYKENAIYRAAEHLFVGVSAGYWLSQGYDNILRTGWDPMVQGGKWWLFVPFVLGIMLYARFFKGIAWMMRWPLSMLVGTGIGLVLRGSIISEFAKQIGATMLPLNHINNFIIIFGTVGVLIHFYFSRTSNSPPLMIAARFGRYLMMVTFGAAFGNTVQGRISLFIARLQYLFGDWLGMIGG